MGTIYLERRAIQTESGTTVGFHMYLVYVESPDTPVEDYRSIAAFPGYNGSPTGKYLDPYVDRLLKDTFDSYDSNDDGVISDDEMASRERRAVYTGADAGRV